jgi:hypothetical protein
MVKLEQVLIWLGIASLAWMILFLSWGEQLVPALIAASTGEGIGPYVVAAMFLGGSAGVVLLAFNLAQGKRCVLPWRLASLGVFLVALLWFGRLYSTMPVS